MYDVLYKRLYMIEALRSHAHCGSEEADECENCA